MARKDVDMINGPLYKSVFKFVLPVIGTNVLSQMFHITDLIVVGWLCGSKAVGAVGATSSIINLVICLFVGISTGSGVVLAQSRGGGEENAVRRAVHTAMLTAVFSGVITTAVGVTFARTFLTLMNTPPDILNMSVLYMRIYFIGSILRLVHVFGAVILRALGDSRSPFRYVIFGGALNVVFNIFFVTVCGMTVDGVAWGTVISEGIAGLLCVWALAKRTDASRFIPGGLFKYFGADCFKKIIRIGVPAGFESATFSIAGIIIQRNINSFGSTVVSGNSAAVNMGNIVYVMITAFGVTASMFMGQNFGAKRFDRIKDLPRVCISGALILLFVAGGTAFIFARPLLTLYINDNPAALDVGVLKMRIMFIGYLGTCFFTVYTGLSRGLGKSLFPAIISMITICALRVAWVEIMLRIIHKPYIIFLGFTVSYFTAAVVMGVYYHVTVKKAQKKHEAGLPA